MVYRLALVSFLILPLLHASETPLGSLAIVNGTAITEEELTQFEDYRTASKPELIERAILYHLAIEQAKKRGLEKEPKVQKEIDHIMYQGFLNSVLRERGSTLAPTSDEVKAFYDENPLFRVTHLVLLTDTIAKKKAALPTIKKIQQELANKIPFKNIVLKYSEDEGARFGGDLDFRGANDLTPEFYKTLKKLRQYAVSEPILLEGSIHFLQWTAQKPFTEIPENYLVYIKSRLRKEKEQSILSKSLSDLRKEAKVELLETKATP